jgi:hypothetical protein
MSPRSQCCCPFGNLSRKKSSIFIFLEDVFFLPGNLISVPIDAVIYMSRRQRSKIMG